MIWHKVKLHFKPLTKFLPLLLFCTGLLPLILLSILLYFFPPLPFVALIAKGVIGWFIIFTLFSLIVRKYRKCIKARLKNLLFVNNFYSYNSTTGEIIKSAEFRYQKKKNKLLIRFYPKGLRISYQMDEIQPILETALGMYVTEMDDSNPRFCEFVLSKYNSGQRINVVDTLSSTFEKSVEPYIQLDAEKQWFYRRDPMAQISGPRGSGKTLFIYYLLLSFARIGADIYLLDPKRSDLSSLRYCFFEDERDKRVATTPAQICRTLRELTELMNKRYIDYFSEENSRIGQDWYDIGLQPVVCFFDEVLAAIEESSSKEAKEIESYVTQIILKGRQSGCFVIISSQRLSADTLNTVIRENCGMRAILGKVQEESYRMALGESFKKLPRAEKGVGKGYIYLDGHVWSTPRAFQAPFLDTSKIDVKATFKRLLENPPIVYKNS